jgi:acetyltransferase-like isoleucine patch superfamily enzyme
MSGQLVIKVRDIFGLLRAEPRRAFQRAWTTFWMILAGRGIAERASTWLAGLVVPPYYGRHRLAKLHRRGYTSPSAKIHHAGLCRGAHTSLGDRVVIYQDAGGGPVSIGARCTVNQDTFLQTGQGGSIEIGQDTHIQPRCQLSAYVGSIRIGDGVSIAPNCALYPYDHRAEPGRPIRGQGLTSRGDIVIEDDVWIATGVIVLADVRVGMGAILAAGSVVTRDVPAGAIAAGSPARVIGHRE